MFVDTQGIGTVGIRVTGPLHSRTLQELCVCMSVMSIYILFVLEAHSPKLS